MTNAGDRYASNEIRYLGREREREANCRRNRWGSTCLILTAHNVVNAYGIVPPVLFRILYWVLGLSMAGAALLWWNVPTARQHGRIWCFGASLSQLLPVIQINKEFTEFFYDPERTRLKGWHIFVFSVLSALGLVLAAALIAAFSQLNQNP